MSIEDYDQKQYESKIYYKLKESELEATSTDVRYSHEDVFSGLRANIADKVRKV